MKLDIACVRSILLTVEKYEHFRAPVSFFTHNHSYAFYDDFLKDYDQPTVCYHVQYCIDAGLLNDSSATLNCFQVSMTPSGHSFLANIRPEKNWTKLRALISQVEGLSLKLVTAASEGIATAVMNKYLNEIFNEI